MERSEHFVSSDLFSFRSWSTLRLGMVRFAAFMFCLNTWQERTVTALTNYKSPLKNWVSASTKFKEHQLSSEFYKAAVGYAEDFLRVQDGKMPSVSQQLSDIYRNTVELNRQKLRSIIKTVVLCGKQNIALRGHRDGSSHIDEASGNSENFQALLNFRVEAGDKVLANHFANGSRNATYRSKTIQNEHRSVRHLHPRQDRCRDQ